MSGFDFTVRDRSGQAKVQADVRAQPGTTREWAAGYWINLEAVDLRPRGEFFLLITPDKLYGWAPAQVKGRGMPTWVLDATNMLAPYYERVGTGPQDIQPLAFVMMVSWWLHELTAAEGSMVIPPALVRTGLPRAMAHGEVVRTEA
ncbi:hypothetical protein [Corallococcus exiguus]|uniref:Uncharacterized protein n=1 Tax=Corallococcus exiguus TaxID=83462 RepID=A0A7X4Y8G7_9BACT|nr:hypothetical protein [Corallococcus exiguus]NBC40869.1 hypothetical protein [Corallococcus exiguus]TNV64489.1 hypothetical protein FH620_12230 [Corallococcus exiguus]